MKSFIAILLWACLLTGAIAQNTDKVSPEYQKAYEQTAAIFQKGDYDGALQSLDKADLIQPNVAAGYNLRGAIYTKQEKYDDAVKAFERAYELDPKLYLPLFNVAEVAFLQKNYEESRKRFEIFVAKNGPNDLADFKLYLCDLLGGNAERAQKTLDAQTLSPLTPVLFYMKAAAQFKKGNDAAAQEEIQSAINVYPAGQNNAFAETFIDLGWLKRKENQPNSSALPDTVLSPSPKAAAPATPKIQPSGTDLLPSLDKEKK